MTQDEYLIDDLMIKFIEKYRSAEQAFKKLSQNDVISFENFQDELKTELGYSDDGLV